MAQRTTIVAIVLFFGLTLGVGANAVVSETEGLVQYKLPGATEWRALRGGIDLPEGTAVVSGARGSAVLEIGNATVTLSPLSRMEVSLASVAAEQERTELSMKYGRVRAQVRRSRDRGTDFRVYTPISTAAVRGTEFVYDGHSLTVQEGDVAAILRNGQHHSVRAGQVCYMWENEWEATVEEAMLEELNF